MQLEQLTGFARARFGHLPTALEPLPRLSARLGGPQLLVKRDDLTGLAFGGNKTRKLEFLLGEALAAGADTLVTAGGVQSNHCRRGRPPRPRLRAGAAAAGRLEPSRLRARRQRPAQPPDAGPAVELERVADALREGGRRPFVVPLGGSTSVGALGYVAAGLEHLVRQGRFARDQTVVFVHTGGTPALFAYADALTE